MHKSQLSDSALKQHIGAATHKRGHILDVAITRDTSALLTSVSVTDPGLCDKNGHLAGDHFAIML